VTHCPLKAESKEIIGKHIKYEMHPVAMDKAAGYNSINTLFTGNTVRL
jgi:hypothetical protein